MKKDIILSKVVKDNSDWIIQNDYDLANLDEIRANNFIALRIKQYMKARGLKQNELARILGVTPQYVNKLLHGQVRNIGVGTLMRYGNKLGIKLVEIPELDSSAQWEKLVETNIKYTIEIHQEPDYESSFNLGSSVINYNKYSYGNAKSN